MGNFLQKFHTTAATDNGDYPTPQMVVLTKAEIELIKETWKIPSAHVRWWDVYNVLSTTRLDLIEESTKY